MRYTTRIIVPPRVRRSGMPGSPGAGPRPQAIGVRKSLGFGDRLGLASAGHLMVGGDHPDFAPFFAQQSGREMADAGRTLPEVIAVAGRAVGNARYRQPWGADADGLRTPQEVDAAAAAGFTYFTIDLSEHIRDDADQLSPTELTAAVDGMVDGGELPEDWCAPYLDRTIELPGNERLQLHIDALRRAAVKFSRAVQHGARMYETVARANHGRPYEIEVSLDQIASPITSSQHLFLGLELEARGVRLTGLALRLDDGHPGQFERALREHVAVASFCGPYKLSFRAGAYDPALNPIIGRCCGDTLHVKTSAESYLEALRLAWRLEPDLFRQIATFGGMLLTADDEATEVIYIDSRDGARQLDEASGHVLMSGKDEGGRPFKTALLELLDRHADIYQELLVTRFDRLIQSLNAG